MGTGPESTSFLSEREKQTWENGVFFADLHHLPMTRRMEVACIESNFIHYCSLISNTANADNNIIILEIRTPVPQTHFPRSKRRRLGYLQAGVQAGLYASVCMIIQGTLLQRAVECSRLLKNKSALYQARSHCYHASTTLLKVVAKHLESYLKRQGCQDTKRRAPWLFLPQSTHPFSPLLKP